VNVEVVLLRDSTWVVVGRLTNYLPESLSLPSAAEDLIQISSSLKKMNIFEY
jgi:hypothetical protein